MTLHKIGIVGALLAGIFSFSLECASQGLDVNTQADAPAVVPVWVQQDVAAHGTMATELSNALERAGYAPLICETTSEIPSESPIVVLVAKQSVLQEIVPSIQPQLSHAESYLVRRVGGSPYVIVTAPDDRGLLYGTVELTEEIALGTEFPDIFPRQQRPFFEVRAFGLQWPGPDVAGEVFDGTPFRTFFPEHLSRNRYNRLILAYSGRASDLCKNSGSQGELAVERLSQLLTQAEARLLDVELWLDPDTNLYTPLENDDSPANRLTFWKNSISEISHTFPSLRLGLWPSDERREQTVGDANLWFDGFLKTPIHENNSIGPPTLAGEGFEPTLFQEEIARHLPAPPLVALKWAGDHPEAALEPYFVDAMWKQQRPHDYRILWTLTEHDIGCLRGGSYQRTRRILKQMGNDRGDLVAGFVFFPRNAEIARETRNKEWVSTRNKWRWGYRKHWYRHALWGRLGFNPDLGFGAFENFFIDQFGETVGKALIREASAGEELLSRLTRFHWHASGDDWYPEACLAPGEGGPFGIYGDRTGPMYRDTGVLAHPFESILEFAFNLPADPTDLSIVEAAGYELTHIAEPRDRGKRLRPVEVAEILRQYTLDLERTINIVEAMSKDDPSLFEARHIAAEFILVRILGNYYRSKILSAYYLVLALCENSEARRALALEEMQRGLSAWKAFTERAEKLYRFPTEIFPGVTSWKELDGIAERDIEIIRTHPPFRKEVTQQPVYGPFVSGSTELIRFEQEVVVGGADPPSPDSEFESPSFTSENPSEQGWLDILNHYSRFLSFDSLSNPNGGTVVWVPIALDDSIGGSVRLRLVGGSISKVLWGGTVAYDERRDGGEELRAGASLVGPARVRTLWARCERPPHTPGITNQPVWGFAIVLEKEPPYLVEPAWWEADGLAVRVRNTSEAGRLEGITFSVEPVGDGWRTPPRDPNPISLSHHRSFLVPCALGQRWAALRLSAAWEREQFDLDFFPPLDHTNLTLLPYVEGARARLFESPAGWCTSTDKRNWQTALLYRVNEAYLQRRQSGIRTHRLRIEWYSGSDPATVVAEYRSTDGGKPRRARLAVPPRESWTYSLISLPGLLEEVGTGEGVLVRIWREDHQDLFVRQVSFE